MGPEERPLQGGPPGGVYRESLSGRVGYPDSGLRLPPAPFGDPISPMTDPRDYQIASLLALNLYGLAALDFEVRPVNVLAILTTALAAQGLGTRWARLPRFEPKSALVSGLGLCMLLRTASPAFAALAAALAIGSKFLIRVRGKHLFNPTDFAIVALLAVGAPVWVSPGQWGSEAFLAFLAACCAFLVLHRSERSDVTIAFLAAWAGLLFARSLWLGEPAAIPLHRLENGALLIFAFFMISDPRTIPNSRPGRLLFAALVALGAYFVQFVLFRTNGLLYSLACCALLVPLIDRLLPGERHEWAVPAPSHHSGPWPETAAAFRRSAVLWPQFREAAVKGAVESAAVPVAPAPRRVDVSPFYGELSQVATGRGADRAALDAIDPRIEPIRF